ncbi:Clock-controlled protein 6 [Colletotrichum spinosum]|uniref:Clock-controlled protein 6 n=1 Tax=Colletotrichum spinosum TaxID=1347390 RepID=A0A4R8PQ51_9PEZI|nr:Clock-controlled protein 6 [Colletotrichum spinosum]
MKFIQFLVPAAGLVSLASAWGKDANTTTIFTTVVTTAYETYCPSPTTFIHHNITYTATSATTLTITNCPCTITTHVPPPYTTTKAIPPPPVVNTTSCPPELSTTIVTVKTPKPPKPTYHNTTVIHTPTPPKPSGHPENPPKPPHHNGTSTTVIGVTPTPETSLVGVTPVPHTPVPGPHTSVEASSPPTKTPVGPSTTRPATVPETGAAHRLGSGVGALAIAALVAVLI